MEYFSPVPLTTAQRPVLLDEEVEIKVIDSVATVLVDSSRAAEDLFPPALLILTNIRLIVVVTASTTPSARAISLKDVQTGEDCATMLRRSTRVRILFHQRRSPKELSFKFGSGGKDEFLEMLLRTLAKKSWEKILPAPAAKAPEAASFSVTNAGVSGIIRRQEKNLESVDALAKNALSDLDALMNRAREVIAVVQRYAAYVVEAKGDDAPDVSDGASETTSQAAETNEMEAILQSIGIVSPITKNTAGRAYHDQLARQIADVLLQQQRLERLGGMITLTDLYCLFNRARGTALVSPDDLLSASQRMAKLKLTMSLRTFPSGVKVLQLDSYSEDSSAKRLADLIQASEAHRSKGVTAYDAAVLLNISLVLAKEQLLIAERLQLLCRDESLQGLLFFPNLFPQFLGQ